MPARQRRVKAKSFERSVSSDIRCWYVIRTGSSNFRADDWIRTSMDPLTRRMPFSVEPHRRRLNTRQFFLRSVRASQWRIQLNSRRSGVPNACQTDAGKKIAIGSLNASGGGLINLKASTAVGTGSWATSRLECLQHPRKSLNIIQLRHQFLVASA